MLAIVIYVVAVVAVVVIGLVTVGRETFAASQVPRPAVFELDEAVAFVSAGLDGRTAGRLTPDDVGWILTADAAQFVDAADHADDPGYDVLDNTVAARRVMDRLQGERRELIDEHDVTAVLAGRSRYLEAIGAIGPQAPDPDRGAAGSA
ncbi:MAG TPA: hypothetical protein VFN21_12530 [Acidimicrobiales bacterium]|nr:hypothetical protein [Acidimicrobiales bacterium]